MELGYYCASAPVRFTLKLVIIQGDALSVLKTLPDESVHCCVTSPPYWGLRDYGVSGQLGLERTPEEYVSRMVEVFREVRRVLRDDGTLWLNIGDSYARTGGEQGGGNRERMHMEGTQRRMTAIPFGSGLKPKDLVGIPWMLAFALRADGWYLRSEIIWHKPNPMPESVKDRPTKAHEQIFLMAKSQDYHYDAAAIDEPADPEAGRDTTTARRNPPPGAKTDSGFQNGRRFKRRNKRSVWTISTWPFPEAHFATFPQKLIEPCIMAGCPKGGTVLDPFAGAGTTGLVAKRLNREFIGIELNPEYVTLAEKRLAQQVLAF